MTLSRNRIGCLLLAILLSLATACGSTGGAEQAGPSWSHQLPELQPLSLSPGQKLQVVATTNIVGDVARNVGGDLIDLNVLLQVGRDPHSYQPVPSDLTAVSRAHLVLASGFGLEEFLLSMLRNAGGSAALAYVSSGIEPRAGHDHEGDQSATADEDHEAADPHVWLDVRHVLLWADNIATVLGALDPSNAPTYQGNAAAYKARLEELDQWIIEQVALIPARNRRLVTNHEAFGYYAERYDLEQVGTVYPISPSAEPSAQDVAKLETAIRELGVKAIFTESTVNPRLAERIAQDAGAKVVPLYSGSLGSPGSGAETYIDMMRYNTNSIVSALR